MIAPVLALPSIRPLTHLPASPWRNGGGETRVIATSALGSGGDIAWRISIATVRDGAAFSLFPEYERIFLPLESGSITLIGAEGEIGSQPDGSSRFAGADAVTARVPAGEAFALNVMTIPGLAAPLLRRRAVVGSFANSDTTVRASVVVRGSVSTPDGSVVDAPAILPAGMNVLATEVEILEVVVVDLADLDDPAEESGRGTA
jgi:environmental stress-induced protein Ves